MQLKPFRLGPVALTTTYTTNIANPPTASGGVGCGSAAQYVTLRQIHIANKTNAAAKFRLWVGATGANAAGTEIAYDYSVAAYSTADLFFANGLRLDAADFLVGGSDTATALTLTGVGEIGVA